jgi:hypothetical protein
MSRVQPRFPSSRVPKAICSPMLASFARHPSYVSFGYPSFLQMPFLASERWWLQQSTVPAGLQELGFDPCLLTDVLDVLNEDSMDLVLGWSHRQDRRRMEDRVQHQGTPKPLKQIWSLELTFSWHMHFDLKRLEQVSQFINTFSGREHHLW